MDEWVTVALVLRARGNRGEVAAELLSSRPDRFGALREVFLFDGDRPLAGQPLAVEAAWEHRGQIILKFRGIDSIPDAERLAGAEVRVPMSERAELGEGEYYHSDLIGCRVVEKRSGRDLGRVTEIREYGGPALLDVEGGTGVIQIPLARSICVEIDVVGRRILVDLPEGLEELNRA